MKLSKNSSAVILSHFNERSDNAGFPPQLIRDYLREKIETIMYIEHAFPHAKDKRSSMTVYVNGKIKTKEYTFSLFGPAPLFYIADIFLTWYFLAKFNRKINLCVALDNLNVFSVYPFKLFGTIEKLIYYTIDYTPIRFPNKILNSIYHYLDRFSCYNADKIWILSHRMTTGRKQNGVNLKKSAESILLPMGANIQKIPLLSLDKIKKNQIIFVGHLLEKQGVQLIIEALPAVLKKIPSLKFIIIGQGTYKNTLVKLANSLEIQKHVSFIGFVEKHEDVEKMLCESAVGLAPYISSSDNYTYYTDPGKPKLYLACGLPVIITDVPESAQIIHKNKAGICIPYTKKAFEKAIIDLLQNDKRYNTYRQNAIKLAKQFNTDTLIKNAVDKI